MFNTNMFNPKMFWPEFQNSIALDICWVTLERRIGNLGTLTHPKVGKNLEDWHQNAYFYLIGQLDVCVVFFHQFCLCKNNSEIVVEIIFSKVCINAQKFYKLLACICTGWSSQVGQGQGSVKAA